MNATAYPPIVATNSVLEAGRLTSGGSMPAPHPDGFGGARDAAILFDYMDADTAADGVVYVQAVARTANLLKRAGVTRQKRHEFYPVRVVADQFKRLQLAPAAPVRVMGLPAPRPVDRSPLAALNRRMICAYNSAQKTWCDYKVSRSELSLSTYLFHLRRCERLQAAIRRTAGVP
jgi:hypothetical protein